MSKPQNDARATRERLAAGHKRAAQRRAGAHGLIITIPFLEWCAMRGFSVSTGRRLIADGKIPATRISDRRIGIRSDHDAAFLAARELTSI
jgi:hypothetical protein